MAKDDKYIDYMYKKLARQPGVIDTQSFIAGGRRPPKTRSLRYLQEKSVRERHKPITLAPLPGNWYNDETE